MRLYRGISVRLNTWVEGYLIVNKDKHYIHPINNIFIAREVLAETIGQYTSVFDCNGKELCEGDRVKIKPIEDLTEAIGVVSFYKGRYVLVLPNNRKGRLDFYQTCRLEIIGNIHENLLTK